MKLQYHKIVKQITICFCSLLLLVNCSKDNDSTSCFGGTWIQEVLPETTEFITAGQLYAQSPTVKNCNSYKNTIINYLDALNRIKDCVPSTSLNDFNTAIEEAKAESSMLNCIIEIE